ncbi:MAG: nucleotide sugar dehydrogenase [Clostridiales Family XIII bacterium]|jgi:UDP-N-acetyl-D-glucosamine dehydrogenase|nr:nucleotide sugar dehydrogenase [Clostridiales Family XIII bacterium]
MKDVLLEKINKREIRVGVVGLGYVGLPLAVEKAKAGFRTVGFDIQQAKVDMVNRGENYIGDVAGDDLEGIVGSGMLRATSDFGFIGEADFIAICVPTPLDSHQQPDVSFVRDSSMEIAKRLKKGAMVVLESTIYPGATEGLVKPLLEAGSGLVCGRDFYLGFSPERVDPGNLVYRTKNTPKVVGAIGSDALGLIAAMYGAVLEGEVHTVSSPAVAEMEKILENTYRNVNIGLVNELAVLCDRMGINIWEVIEAAKTKPYGFQPFYPGPGLGGHCIPLDPYYLSWKAREHGFHTSMIESSMMVNDRMPEYVAERISRILNRFKKPLNGAKVLLLGVAYKQDVGDCRESPALKVLECLEAAGAVADYYDPHVPECVHGGRPRKGLAAITPELLAGYDLVVITTAHTDVDYGMVAESAAFVFDTKNAARSVAARDRIELL